MRLLIAALRAMAMAHLRGWVHDMAVFPPGGGRALELPNGTHVPLAGAVGCRECEVDIDGGVRNGTLHVRTVGSERPLPLRAHGGPMQVLHIVVRTPQQDDAWASAAIASGAAAAADVVSVSAGAAHAVYEYRTHNASTAHVECDFGAVTVQALHDVDHAAYDHIVTTLPLRFGEVNGSSTCVYDGVHWSGLGQVGGRFSWVRTGSPDAVHGRTMFHEIGHNWGLGHAGAGGDDYGDTTCSMGNVGALRGNTLSAPMLHMLGWAHAAAIEPGVGRHLSSLGTTNDVLLLDDDLTVSFRGRLGHDAAVAPGAQNTMYVHRTDGIHTELLHASNAPFTGRRGTVRAELTSATAVTVRYDDSVVAPWVVVLGLACAAGVAALAQTPPAAVRKSVALRRVARGAL